MCGRVIQTTPAGTMARTFGAALNGAQLFEPGEYGAGEKTLAIVTGENGPEATVITWGLEAEWLPRGELLRHARAETALRKRTFQESAHARVAETAAPGAQEPLTAAFSGVPERHDGEASFEFDLTLSAEPADGFSYRVFRGDSAADAVRPSALAVTNGTVTGASRKPDENGNTTNLAWTVAIEPAGDDAVTVTLPATTDCAAVNAICTGGGVMLATAVSATIAGPETGEEQSAEPETPQGAFAVSFGTSPPAEHDGTNAFRFTLAFSDELASGFSYRTLRDHALVIAQDGTRLTPYIVRGASGEVGVTTSNRVWNVRVEPAGRGSIAIAIAPTTDCSAPGALCTGDGTRLTRTVSATVFGPPGLSVADATAEEAEGATVDFAVSLSRAAAESVTVDYATSDGTAEAGSDYEAASGTLTFAPGETAKTVAVAMHDDSHDEGSPYGWRRIPSVGTILWSETYTASSR